MIELFVSDNDVTSGSIAVTWCVSTETLDLLAERKVQDPQIVICVSPEGKAYDPRKEYRKVVPLKDLMTYVEFRVSGKNKITAVVSSKTRKDAKNTYLTKERGLYETHVLDCDGEDYASWLKRNQDEDDDAKDTLAVPITVNVPRECFAPEPSAWEKTWVNHFFRDKPIDQCSYRRRRLFAYLVQPFIMFALALVKFFLLLGATLIGSRGWSLKYLLHPLTYDIDSSLGVLFGGSIFIRRLLEDKPSSPPPHMIWYLVKKFCLLPLMPLIAIPLLLLTYFHVLWVGGLVVATLVALFLVVIFFASGTAKDVFFGAIELIAKLFGKLSSDDLWYMRQEEMAMIVCDGRKKNVSISALPAKKRTIALRFHDLKSKVCRPFSA